MGSVPWLGRRILFTEQYLNLTSIGTGKQRPKVNNLNIFILYQSKMARSEIYFDFLINIPNKCFVNRDYYEKKR